MGISVSCRMDEGREVLGAIRAGDVQRVKLLVDLKPRLINGSLTRTGISPLHYAASHGQTGVLVLLLEFGAAVNVLNHRRQTPLMLACKHGRLACTDRLLEWGADALIFYSSNGRTCLHIAAKNGHVACVHRVLVAAQLPAVSQTWGFVRFVNARDENGATPLHLAARNCHSTVVHLLLGSGALVCATTTGRGRSGPGCESTPLHYAAQGGSTSCVKELLAWGADRTQRNSQGQTPFLIAMKYHHTACAALLNPLTAEPIVWPSPWKFMQNLDPDARLLLEGALARANDAWERKIVSIENETCGAHSSQGEAEDEDDSYETDSEKSELCYICLEQACTIEVQDCGHQMCAGCTLALCCHNKPNPTMAISPPPACPFCRHIIGQLKCVEPKEAMKQQEEEEDKADEKLKSASKSKRPANEGSTNSSSFMGLVGKGSFRLLSSARSSCRVADIDMKKESSSQQAQQDWACLDTTL